MSETSFINVSKKQLVAIVTTAALAVGGVVAVASNASYTEGRRSGVRSGIVQGRNGYIKGYTGGTVAIEGYDGLGNDYNCANGTWIFRGDQIGNLKAGVEYDYRTVKGVFPLYAESYKQAAEAVCRNLGYQP